VKYCQPYKLILPDEPPCREKVSRMYVKHHKLSIGKPYKKIQVFDPSSSFSASHSFIYDDL